MTREERILLDIAGLKATTLPKDVSIGSADVMPLMNTAEEYPNTIETLINNKIESLQ